jgi:hypothetical protein
MLACGDEPAIHIHTSTCETQSGGSLSCDALSLEVRVDLATTAEANREDPIFTRNIDNMIGNNNSQCMVAVRCRVLILVCVYARGCTKLRNQETHVHGPATNRTRRSFLRCTASAEGGSGWK